MIPGVPRIIAIMLVLAGAGGLATGCGGANSAPKTGASGASSAVTKAHASAYAHAVNLRAADVPGLAFVSAETETAKGGFATELTRCGGALPGTQAGSIHSARFTRGSGPGLETVKSGVQVVASAAVAARNVAANQSAGVRACFARAVRSLGPAPDLHVAISSLPTRLAGVEASFGLRIGVVSTPPRERPFRVYQDILGFASGPAEIALTTTRTRVSGTTPSASERRLLSLLYRRASTYPL